MALIGMSEAAKRLGVTPNSARRALQNAKVPLVVITSRTYAVEESDLEEFAKSRVGYAGFGRPSKKSRTENDDSQKPKMEPTNAGPEQQ